MTTRISLTGSITETQALLRSATDSGRLADHRGPTQIGNHLWRLDLWLHPEPGTHTPTQPAPATIEHRLPAAALTRAGAAVLVLAAATAAGYWLAGPSGALAAAAVTAAIGLLLGIAAELHHDNTATHAG